MRSSVFSRFIVFLSLFLVLCVTGAQAETWICANCGQEGNEGNFCSNCGSARPESSVETEIKEHPGLWKIAGVSDRVEVGAARIDASSYIQNKKDPSRWEPAKAMDHDESTCWQFSAKKGLGKKAWLSLDMEYGEAVDEIWFKNGFWAYNDKGGEQYSINARPREILVEINYNGEAGSLDKITLTLRDECFQDWQRFDIGRHEAVNFINISIQSIYKGSKFPNDVCLSEVMLVQKASSEYGMDPWWSSSSSGTVYESRQDLSNISLLMKLATRSGPGTQYDGPGTFFGSNWAKKTVRALGKSWDGSVWWVLVDFSNGGKASYRVWTGLKRLDVKIDQLPEVNPIGQGTVSATSHTYRGPGGNYAKAKVTISSWKDVVAYGRENGYVEVEFIQGSTWYRVWVPESETSIDWGNDFSGEG